MLTGGKYTLKYDFPSGREFSRHLDRSNQLTNTVSLFWFFFDFLHVIFLQVGGHFRLEQELRCK